MSVQVVLHIDQLLPEMMMFNLSSSDSDSDVEVVNKSANAAIKSFNDLFSDDDKKKKKK